MCIRDRAQAVREFIAERGTVHPREVEAHFAHGKTTNWFGGSSNASTQLLDGMHYRGLLRVAGRASGTRTYAVREDAVAVDKAGIDARLDALVDVIVHKYAPLPDASLGQLVSYLGRGVPQWDAARKPALLRARQRLQRARAVSYTHLDVYKRQDHRTGRIDARPGQQAAVGRLFQA